MKNIDNFFEITEDKKMIFKGNILKIYIPKFYEDRGLLVIENKIKTLGILKMEIDEKIKVNLMMITMLTLSTDKISIVKEENVTYDNEIDEYYCLEFSNNSIFIENTVLIKDPNILYKLFMTFIALGKIPKFLNYNDLSTIFDNDNLLCGANLGVNHSVYEMIFSHMSRDRKDPFKHYRLTDKTDSPLFIPLHSIAFGPKSTTAKIIGSYFGDALTSSMIAPHDDEGYDLENLLRA